MKKFFIICLLLAVVSCSKEKQGNMIVQGQIKGLKKATLYLQKMKDTLVISVDSISLFGNDTFRLVDNIDSPEMYYLTFDTNTSEKRIMFFAEQGTITINDDVANFGVDTEIEGSSNQKVFDDYKKITSKFQNKQLDLMKANFDAQKEKNLKKSDSLRKVSESEVTRRYLYSINFALAHPDSEATPYIVLTDLVNANIKYLDTINNSLTDRVKSSFYGKKLDKFIADIKKSEGN
mgnify:CR=1 FL=1|tara:strand:+ start:33315 stop:34016 length:702 start_codon:yes stop_codon:yes gene_type:complete